MKQVVARFRNNARLTSFGSFGRQKDEWGPSFDFAAIFTKFDQVSSGSVYF